MPTVCELKIKAKSLGLTGYSNLRKADLEFLIESNTPKTVRVKKPLAQQKRFKEGVEKTKTALARGVVMTAVERAIAKYKANKMAEKKQNIRKYFERTPTEQRLRDLIREAEQEAYGKFAGRMGFV
jgi:hypothetical protein